MFAAFNSNADRALRQRVFNIFAPLHGEDAAGLIKIEKARGVQIVPAFYTVHVKVIERVFVAVVFVDQRKRGAAPAQCRALWQGRA